MKQHVSDKKMREKHPLARVRTAATGAELQLRRWLRAHGFWYRVNVPTLAGRPDLVLSQHNTVIFVHGCFWHGHTKCQKFQWPKSNAAFWRAKIRGNQRRDAANVADLQKRGWHVEQIWECELTDEAKLLRLAAKLLRRPKAGRTAG